MTFNDNITNFHLLMNMKNFQKKSEVVHGATQL